tara:strand:+ start:6778 stop:7605 length:828 start_codon:yes stop_codon:yes gene_type:complete
MKNLLDNGKLKVKEMKPKKIIVFLIILLIAYVGITYIGQSSQENPIAKIKNILQVAFKKNIKQSKLIIPSKKLMPSSLENESFFQNHWESDNGYFMLVSDDISSKQSPSLTAANYEALFKTERVRILYENSQATDVDGQLRHWVFLGSETGKTYLGWIFKDQLISKDEFIRYEPLEEMRYIYRQGDLKSHIVIEKNGRFQLNWSATGGGLFLKGKDKGQLYIYEDIIWAKKDNQDFLYNFFITNSTNELIQEYRFRDDHIKMEIFTLPKQGEIKK